MIKHLLVDDALIARTWRLRRCYHQPRKHRAPILRPEKPWEGGRVSLWSPPLRDPSAGCWRMWYHASEDLLPLHAVSTDGIEWERPEHGLVQYDGSRANNIIDLGFRGRGKENRIVVVPDWADEDAPLKALTRIEGRLQPLVSADGLRWELRRQGGIPSNDEYRLGRDEVTGRFIATVKGTGATPAPELGRAVSLSVSDDFVTWTEPELVFYSDQRDDEMGAVMVEEMAADGRMRSPQVMQPAEYRTDVYNMPVFRYEDIYLGLPVMFHQTGAYRHRPQTDPTATNQDGVLYPQLVLSRDLLHWERLAAREPFIPPSPCGDDEIIDNGMVMCTPPQQFGDELRFYYTGTRYTHISREALESMGLLAGPDEALGAIFLATLRVDGFASMRADSAPGALLTRPLSVDGGRLCVNADASEGELRVELRDAGTGRPIPGYSLGDSIAPRLQRLADGTEIAVAAGPGARLPDEPNTDASVPLRTDAVRAQVAWKGGGDLCSLQGRQVRIYFGLRNADLYSLWFEE